VARGRVRPGFRDLDSLANSCHHRLRVLSISTNLYPPVRVSSTSYSLTVAYTASAHCALTVLTVVIALPLPVVCIYWAGPSWSSATGSPSRTPHRHQQGPTKGKRMSMDDANGRRPRVLFVYYTHTNQAQRVCESMAEVLRARGCEVSKAGIEFTDPHYAKNFSVFPFKHAVFGILPLLWPQVRRKTGRIRIPDEAKTSSYDLICLGSPTWFFRTCMPLRSYLKSDEARTVLAGKPFAAYVVCRRYWSINLKEVRTLGTSQGGEYLDGIRFTYEGGQIRSLLSLLSYFGKGEMRERSLGIKIPPTNLKPDFDDPAHAFANKLADSLGPEQQLGEGSSSHASDG
jgi:hypothetical protein